MKSWIQAAIFRLLLVCGSILVWLESGEIIDWASLVGGFSFVALFWRFKLWIGFCGVAAISLLGFWSIWRQVLSADSGAIYISGFLWDGGISTKGLDSLAAWQPTGKSAGTLLERMERYYFILICLLRFTKFSLHRLVGRSKKGKLDMIICHYFGCRGISSLFFPFCTWFYYFGARAVTMRDALIWMVLCMKRFYCRWDASVCVGNCILG